MHSKQTIRYSAGLKDVISCFQGGYRISDSLFPVIKVFPFAVAVFLISFVSATRLDLGLDSTCTFKQIIKDVYGAGFAKEPGEEPFQPSYDVSTVGLVAKLVGLPCFFFYLIIGSTLYESGDVG